jgi:NAD(P)-dependent dehydrogenase (short-subunit alcohol dehydrogenase family)
LRFKGKVVLVTGAGRNIGAAIARAFGAEGATVAAADLVLSSAKETAQQIQGGGGEAQAWELDVATEGSVCEVVRQVRQRFGNIHVLVNNAAAVPRNPAANVPVQEMSLELWNHFFQVNAQGPFLMSREVSRVMIRGGVRGRIVNITSGAGESARIGAAHYCCSKAALAMLTRVMALELGPYGITVNSVSPGLIQVQMEMTPVRLEFMKSFLKAIPLNRYGQPEEIARAVLFLAEEDSGYITGESLRVDGGALAGRFHLPRGG